MRDILTRENIEAHKRAMFKDMEKHKKEQAMNNEQAVSNEIPNCNMCAELQARIKHLNKIIKEQDHRNAQAMHEIEKTKTIDGSLTAFANAFVDLLSDTLENIKSTIINMTDEEFKKFTEDTIIKNHKTWETVLKWRQSSTTFNFSTEEKLTENGIPQGGYNED